MKGEKIYPEDYIYKSGINSNLEVIPCCKYMIGVIRELFGKLRVFETVIPASVKLKES